MDTDSIKSSNNNIGVKNVTGVDGIKNNKWPNALMLIIITILITILLILIYPSKFIKDFDSVGKTTEWIIIGITIAVAIGIIAYASVKYFIPLHIFSFFSKIKYIIILTLYVVGVTILFGSINPQLLKYYAPYILSVIILIAGWLFFKALSERDNVHSISINYHFMSYSWTFFLFLVFLLVLYLYNKEFISQHTNIFFSSSAFLLLFGFLFLLTFIFTPGANENSIKNVTNSINTSSILFIIILISILISGSYYLGRHDSQTKNYTAILIMFILISLLCICSLIGNTISNSSAQKAMEENNQSLLSKIFKKSCLILFGLGFSIYLIIWIFDLINKTSDTTQTIINIFTVVVGFVILFKLLSNTILYKKNPWLRLVVDTIFYIPCILVNILDSINDYLIKPIWNNSNLRNMASDGYSNIKETEPIYYLILGITIYLYLYKYLISPFLFKNNAEQGGILLVNKPVNISEKNILGSYIALNDIRDYATLGVKTTNPYPYNYEFAISLWTSIQKNPNNQSSNVSILNVYDIMKVDYDTSKNTYKFMILSNKTPVVESTDNNYINVCEESNVLLQKWNNIILNYSNGTFDIFYNGKLIKSAINIVPQMTYGSIIIGDPNTNLMGGICNVNYFNTYLSTSQIYNIYNSVKSITPPIPMINEDTTIIPESTWKKYAQRDNSVQEKNESSVGSDYKFNIPLSFKESSSGKLSIDNIDKDLDSDLDINQSKFDSNYLSLKWFFKNNGDKYSGL